MCHLWMPFYSFVLSVSHCRSIQIVCSACYTWCYKITTEVWNLAVQYSMYLNVCCAININVYNIFYNTGEATSLYDTSWQNELIGRNVAWEMSLRFVCLSLFTSEKHLKGSLWRAVPCTLMDSILCAGRKTKQCNTHWCEVYFLHLLASFLFFSFFSQYFLLIECW